MVYPGSNFPSPKAKLRLPFVIRIGGEQSPRGRWNAMRRTALFGVVVLVMIALPAVGADARTPRCDFRRATIVGTNRADVVRGTPRRDVIVGLGGADTIYGLGGNDVVCAGQGNDRILGGTGGFDLLFGQGGGDGLLGGGGFDILLGGPGNDLFNGGSRNDLLSYDQSPAAVIVDLAAGTATGEGSDTIQNVEALEGSPFNDSITGSDVTEEFFLGRGGDDIIDGGGGPDWAQYLFASGPVTVDLTAGTAMGEGTDTLVAIEHVEASEFGDSITGDAGTNFLVGRSGNDTINGLDGEDFLFGQNGNDILDGGNGNDEISGGGGTDTCTNGETVDACEA